VRNVSQSFYLQDGGKNQLAYIGNKLTSLSPYVYTYLLTTDRSSYYLNVSESAPPGTSIGRVVAVDLDASPRFARVVYRIRRHTGSTIGGGGESETENDRGDAFEVG